MKINKKWLIKICALIIICTLIISYISYLNYKTKNPDSLKLYTFGWCISNTVVDSQNNLIFLYRDYLKEEIMMVSISSDGTNIKTMKTGVKWEYYHMNITIDPKDNIHFFGTHIFDAGDYNYYSVGLVYIVFDTNGKLLNGPVVLHDDNFRTENMRVLIDKNENLLVFWEDSSNDIMFQIINNTFGKMSKPSYLLSSTGNWQVFVSDDLRIHICKEKYWTVYEKPGNYTYYRFTESGELEYETDMANMSISSLIPIISYKNSLIYFGSYGEMDSDNNLILVHAEQKTIDDRSIEMVEYKKMNVNSSILYSNELKYYKPQGQHYNIIIEYLSYCIDHNGDLRVVFFVNARWYNHSDPSGESAIVFSKISKNGQIVYLSD